LILTSSFGGGAMAASCQGDAASRLLGKALPTMKGVMSDGSGFDLGAIKLPAVIRVWGLWCPPCIVDEPHWQAVIRGLRTGPHAVDGLNVMAIHVGHAPRNGPTLQEWVAAQAPDIAVPQVNDASTRVMTAIGIPGTPSTLVVDAQGVVCDHAWQFRSDRGVRNFVRKVAALLDQA
jgi:AhpC/TSA family